MQEYFIRNEGLTACESAELLGFIPVTACSVFGSKSFVRNGSSLCRKAILSLADSFVG